MQPCLRVLSWDWDFSLHFTYGSNIPLKRSRRRSTAAGVAPNHLGREDTAQINAHSARYGRRAELQHCKLVSEAKFLTVMQLQEMNSPTCYGYRKVWLEQEQFHLYLMRFPSKDILGFLGSSSRSI